MGNQQASNEQVSIDSEALADLLRAATEVETEVKEALAADTLPGDDIDAPADGTEVPTLEELAAHIALLEDQLLALTASAAPGADAQADFDADPDLADPELSEGPDGLAAGVAEDAEFDPTLLPEGKALGWAPCPNCGSTNADVFDDGTARCEDCGMPLVRSEEKAAGGWDVGVDYDEPDDPVEESVDVKELAVAVLDVYQALGALLGDAADTDLTAGQAVATGGRLSELEVLQARREGLST